MKTNRYICLIKDDYGDEYRLGQGVTTNLQELKQLQKDLKKEDVKCKIFQLVEIK